MILSVHNDNGTITQHPISKESLFKKSLKNRVFYISSSSKEQNALNIYSSYFSNAKAILFDESNHTLQDKLQPLNIPHIDTNSKAQTIFDDKEFNLLYFTSGSTGESTAALKTQQNIHSEIQALSKLLKKYAIKRVLVTVPFIHIYGSLTGLFYPLLNDIDIILKEHFLPHDLLELVDENSLVVTTPLYIKALNQVQSKKDLSKSLFLSSTAPLDPKEAVTFNQKFSCDIMQLFGSTETGGIAYKFNDESLWTPLENVTVQTNANQELKVSSPFVSQTLYEKEFKHTQGSIQTFDYIEQHSKQFKLIGRSSQILKIAGKRYSTVQIEHILEEHADISKALVYVKNDKDLLRDEILDITIESNKVFTKKEIKQYIQKHLSNLKFSMDLKIVEKIPTSSVGKKLRIKS